MQLVDGALALAAVVLLLWLGRTVLSGRRRLHVLALALFVANAVVVKKAAMVLPRRSRCSSP